MTDRFAEQESRNVSDRLACGLNGSIAGVIVSKTARYISLVCHSTGQEIVTYVEETRIFITIFTI